jgi:acetylornithine/N-succinyldiaminopimelate aminotransferase
MTDDIIPFYKPGEKLIVKSKGCYQYDHEGRQYIDFESGVWCVNIGHSPDMLVKAISNQLKESVHHGYRFRNEFAEKLSIELQRLTGLENGSAVFLSSGSEAVNLSITLARHLTSREKILKIDNSYLSAFGFGQISDDNSCLVNLKFNDTAAISDIDFRAVSAVVLETGGASVDIVRLPDVDFIQHLIAKATENNCLIIADEVTTGFGRMGKWFGFQHHDFLPDIVVVGKALGNGYPVSGIVANKKVSLQFQANPFRYAQSHQNDPLGCAAALEVIKIIEENNLIERCRNIGASFKNQLEALKNCHSNKVKEIRGTGLMLALEFEEHIQGETINNQLFEQGFVIGFKQNTLRFLPPLTIETDDIDKLFEALQNLLVFV